MAGKGIEGQLDMFELFGSVEELEENVKGVPGWSHLPEEQSQPETQNEQSGLEASSEQTEPGVSAAAETWQPSAAPVMQRSFYSSTAGSTAVIAYLDYNMVYRKDWEGEPVIYRFEHSKDAVDFYVNQMERFLSGRDVKVQKRQEALLAASVIAWTGESEG